MVPIVVILCLLLAFGAVQARMRLALLDVVDGPGEADPEGFRVVAATDVAVSPQTLRAVAAYARAHDLDVVDLVPESLSAQDLVALVELVNPKAFATQPLGRGFSAGYAVVVSPEVAERAAEELAAAAGAPPGRFVQIAGSLRHFAPRRAALAVAPGLTAPARTALTRRRVLAATIPNGMEQGMLAVRLGFYATLTALIVIAPWPGVLPLVLHHLQPMAAVAGRRFAGIDMLGSVLYRVPLQLWQDLAQLLTVPLDPAVDAEHRQVYAKLMERGIEPFFEPRREDCPFCGAIQLERQVVCRDYYLYKPGRFRLDRCDGCGHIFQNPRLTVDGLDFYYRDFYDGLGEALMESAFSSTDALYVQRCELVAAHGEPVNWLDVGAGHAHFSLVAQDVLPDTRFDGLDLGEGVMRAARRGWVSEAHQGLFPERSESLRGRYDVVSMHHYLEHTLDPGAEIAAAAVVLEEGGLLEIEVPDPECVLGRVLGRWWIPWFQPQHLNLLSTTNLGVLLDRHGFDALQWHRGEANTANNFFLSALLQLHRLAGGPLDRPWRPPSSWVARIRHGAVWGLGWWWLVTGAVIDAATLPLGNRREGWANAYRVVARRRAHDQGPAIS